jgi:hypothetical protein
METVFVIGMSTFVGSLNLGPAFLIVCSHCASGVREAEWLFVSSGPFVLSKTLSGFAVVLNSKIPSPHKSVTLDTSLFFSVTGVWAVHALFRRRLRNMTPSLSLKSGPGARRAGR